MGAFGGECDETAGIYAGHMHIFTTVTQGLRIKAALKSHAAYAKTDLIKRPLHHEALDPGDRASTITYLLKAYWANRNSFYKRDCQVARAPEQPLKPQQLAEVLLWFDTLRVGDLVYTSGATLSQQLRRM